MDTDDLPSPGDSHVESDIQPAFSEWQLNIVVPELVFWKLKLGGARK